MLSIYSEHRKPILTSTCANSWFSFSNNLNFCINVFYVSFCSNSFFFTLCTVCILLFCLVYFVFWCTYMLLINFKLKLLLTHPSGWSFQVLVCWRASPCWRWCRCWGWRPLLLLLLDLCPGGGYRGRETGHQDLKLGKLMQRVKGRDGQVRVDDEFFTCKGKMWNIWFRLCLNVLQYYLDLISILSKRPTKIIMVYVLGF